MSMTLMAPTSTNQMGSATVTLLTIHLSVGTRRCYLEGTTSLQILYSHTNRSLADLTQKPSTKHQKRISPGPRSTSPDPQPDTQSFRSTDSKPRDPDPSQIQLKEPQSEPSTTDAQGNLTRFMVPGQPGGVQPESNPGDRHHHSQTPCHNLSTQARKKIHHQGSSSSRPTSSTPLAHRRLSRHQANKNTHKSHGSEMFSHLWPTSTPSQRSKNTTSLTNNASPGTTHHPNIGREPHLNHTIFKPFKAPFPISQSATSTPNQQHQTSTKQTSFTSLSSPQRPPNPQLGFSEQARTEDINSQVAHHTPPHRSAQPQHQPDGISLSPRSTSAISAGYRGFRDPGNGFRHPGPQEETQRSRTTGRNPGTQNHHKEPATEEPIRRQTRAPAPNFNRISLSPQSTSAIPARYRRFQYHGNGLRHPQPQEEPTRRQTRAPVPNFERISLSPRSTSTAHRVDSHSSKPTVLEQIHRPRTDPQTQIRSINPEQIHRYRNQSPSGPDIQTTHRSHSEVLNQAREENFAKSTIHIGDLSQIQGVPGPWEWI
jgi:hypothetical protein